MSDTTWKPGETCVFKGQWATVNYLVSRDQAIITTDDQRQVKVALAALTSSVIRAVGQLESLARGSYGEKHR